MVREEKQDGTETEEDFVVVPTGSNLSSQDEATPTRGEEDPVTEVPSVKVWEEWGRGEGEIK